MIKKISVIIVIFIVGMIGGIFANEILWPYFVEKPLFYEYGLNKSPVYVTEVKEIYIQENIALIDAIERAGKTVVAIRTETKAGNILDGSGLIVTSDGLMVTLAELVPQGANFSFFIDRERVSFQILKRDLEQNLALVKISDSILSTVGFAMPEGLKIGERVFLVGTVFRGRNPLKLANEGIIKGFDQNFIETSIIEDNFLAGSPIFNIKGEVIGISIIDNKGRVRAISISKIRDFIGL